MQNGIAIIVLSFAFGSTSIAANHTKEMARSLALFKTDVRDVLVKSCVKCHGGEDLRSEFDLTTREKLLAGGAIGVSVIAGNAHASPIIGYLTHGVEPFMPANQPQLSKETISAIVKWIDLGAAYDKPLVDRVMNRDGPMQVTNAHREYWAFAPLQTDFPNGSGIDNFVRAKQKEHGLTAAPEASKRTLIRRLYFDLTGLPPQPAEIDAFLADKSPDAYERLIDQLLASPHFGERWARHWLDVARFAESHGFEHDYDRVTAFHFRDFVIRAFNQDMPYDRFVRWQLAGDELAPDDPLAMTATGFLGAGVYPTQITINEAERIRYDAMDDMLATTGSAMLAITIGCAGCHDHKYDPIPTRDYYRMLSIFTTTVRTEVALNLGLCNKELDAKYTKQLTDLRAALSKYEAEQLPIAFQRWSDSRAGISDTARPLNRILPEFLLEPPDRPLSAPDPAITAAERKILALMKESSDPASDATLLYHFKPLDPDYRKLASEIAAIEAIRKESIQTVMICSEGDHVEPMVLHTSSDKIPHFYKESYFLEHGDTNQKEGVAEPGFLQVLTRTDETPARWINASKDNRTSGRRAALSQWITDEESGAGHLLARVIVNRLWQHYFGQGIVATPNNFGTQGDRPTHPQLLDWLAAELIRNGWHLKPIHKLILMSETYRTGKLVSAENENIDPDNRFLWRWAPRRLEAEAIRDNALAVGGMLDRTMFGAGTLDEATRRRSIYFTIKRGQLVPTMQMFDWPDTLSSEGRRAVTTTPSQALVFINHPQFRRMAEEFAVRITDETDRIGKAYIIAYGRPPSDRERTLAEVFIRRQALSHNGDAHKTFTDFCAALMSANEFIYIE